MTIGLRDKFIILIIGVLLLPILAGGIIAVYQIHTFDSLSSPDRYFIIYDLMASELNDFIHRQTPLDEETKEEIEQLKEILDFVILKDEEIFFSTLADFSQGLRIDGNFQGTLSELYPRKDILSFNILQDDFIGKSIFLVNPLEIYEDKDRGGLLIIVIFLGSILVFTTITSVLIIRSIRKSISYLKIATGRIADGDLAFKLEIKGNDEFSSLSNSFEQMRQKLIEQYARQARFLMSVSHDLKTPLASIEGYVNALLDGLAEDEETETKYLNIIKDKSIILGQRITTLIQFVKLSTGEWLTAQKPEDLGNFIVQLSDSFADEAYIHNADFNSDISLYDSIKVKMDKDLILRAMENIFQNALKFSFEPINIWLKARVNYDETKIILELGNKGPGIKKENLHLVFEPFFREDNGRNAPGFGLGLASVKSIIDSHGWEIAVDSIENEQTVFSILIPISNKKLMAPFQEL